MGCGASTHPAVPQPGIDPKRRCSSGATLPYPCYWTVWSAEDGVPDVEGSVFRLCVECHETHEDFQAVQELLDRTSSMQAEDALHIKKLFRVEDSRLWLQYGQGLTCIQEARAQREETSDEEDEESIEHALDTSQALSYAGSPSGSIGTSPGLILAETRSGTQQKRPLTTRVLPVLFRERLLKTSPVNEAYLWHGANRAAAHSIEKNGFNTSFAGDANGAVLGKGAYLAESSTLADKYATAGEDGLHAMLLVRACLGKVYATTRYTQWRGKRLVRAVSTRRIVRSGNYDSVLGDRSKAFNLNVREYCVANQTQLYPEYLILYERESLKDA